MTRLLLDTHLLLWGLTDDARLPTAAVGRVMAPEVEASISQVSLWEMAIERSLSRLEVDLSALEHQMTDLGFRWLPLRNAHLLAAAALESDGIHRDPFDRLLICQSRVEPMLFVTADRQLEGYGSTVIVF